jgi:tetratricopeptide (TPR) repeat protein
MRNKLFKSMMVISIIIIPILFSCASTRQTFVAIDKSVPSYTLYFGIPSGFPEKKFEELKKEAAKEEGREIITWENFKQDPYKYITARIIKNEYSDYQIEKGMTELIKKTGVQGVPIGLTWNGGIAVTRSDYEHAERTYRDYQNNPVDYERTRIRDPSRDPVNPGNHFLSLLGNAYTREKSREYKDATVYIRHGILSTERGRYDDAISYFSKAIEIDPRLVEAYKNRGNIYSRMGKYDQAILDYNKALEIDPADAWVYHYRGNAYHKKGNDDQAISNYNKAFEMNPNDILAYKSRGNSYLSMGKYDQAISDFNKAMEIIPSDAPAYYLRGKAYYFKKEYDKSWEDVNKAQNLGLKIPPKFLDDLRKASGREN